VCDGLLARFDNQVDVIAIAFADDLAIMVGLKKTESVERVLNLYMKTFTKWCESTVLQIAREKTEIILLTGMRFSKIFDITLVATTLSTCDTVKYLGVVLDSRRSFYNHVETVCARADAVVGAIRGLLPNVNGPSNACRRLYYQVWESVVLYASSVWQEALKMGKVVDELRKAQRSAVIGTSTAYRTVSYAALCLLTGTMPIHIRA
jgi:predicted nucleic-acid-binding Zn-ribbon protein